MHHTYACISNKTISKKQVMQEIIDFITDGVVFDFLDRSDEKLEVLS